MCYGKFRFSTKISCVEEYKRNRGQNLRRNHTIVLKAPNKLTGVDLEPQNLVKRNETWSCTTLLQ